MYDTAFQMYDTENRFFMLIMIFSLEQKYNFSYKIDLNRNLQNFFQQKSR